MNDRLRILDVQIPILEEKLKALKAERKRLRLSAANRRKWQDPVYRAKSSEAARLRASTPRNKAHFAAVHHNGPPLPFKPGTPEFRLYRKLRRYGQTREAALAEVRAEAA